MTSGSDGPRVVLLHWLGGSARTWDEVCPWLEEQGFRCAAIDLPGFGASADAVDFSLEATVRSVIETIRLLRAGEADAPWLLVGHSMGGKVAGLVARAAEQGEEGLDLLRGVVLLSPSPPSPEPMAESKREAAIRELGPETRDPARRRAHAAQFVEDNTGRLPLVEAVRTRSIDDVLRMNPDALVTWMTTGSKVDCSDEVGILAVPALILAGTEEEALGPEAQRRHTLPHFPRGTLLALDGCGHLAPLERPFEVSDRMVEFFRSTGVVGKAGGPGLSPAWTALIESERTSPLTRQVLLDRLQDEPPTRDGMSPEELRTLRALAARVVPHAGFDLAPRIVRALAASKHDGWRFSGLPEDGAAWRQGLASLDAASAREFSVPFVALDAERQDVLLRKAQDGALGKGLLGTLHFGEGADAFDARQMRDWFEDVRGEMVKAYVSDPRTMERIGFTGFADEQGFTKIRLGERDEVAG